MTWCNNVNVKLQISQLNKLKSATKNETEATLKLSSNMTGNSYDEANLSYMFFTCEQVKKNHFGFFTRNCKSITNLFHEFILAWVWYNISIKWLDLTV